MPDRTPPFTPFADHSETIEITPELAGRAGLREWADSFALGTAGYRDLLDPEDLHDLGVPFNSLTLAVLLEARARLAEEAGLRSLHVGGEVRAHTRELIDLAARIYAAHGLTVRLRPPDHRTTPIWLSSFAVFHEELDGGENFTASHSQSFKGGWKPMDAGGGQLLEMAVRIAQRVRALVARAATEGLQIRLAASDDPLIRRDLDPVGPYLEVLRATVGEGLLAEVPRGVEGGFRAAFCTEGGSMGETALRMFRQLGWPAGPDRPLFFTHFAESSDYHGIGVVDGVDHGVDPGKPEVYKNVGAQALLAGRRADVFFLWDPDGDRFNMVSTAPAGLAAAAAAAGLEVDPLDGERCLVFFKPNQIYFLLTAARLEALGAEGRLAGRDWIAATTWPTSRSIGEVARAIAGRQGTELATYRAPVGFKHFARLVRDLEAELDERGEADRDLTAEEATGRRVALGRRPRLLIMAEESGGAALGPLDPVRSRAGRRLSLAPKEKDAFQIGVVALALAARLHREGGSFAARYLELLREHGIVHRFYERRDVTLFDESLQGEDRERARAEGNERKRTTVDFFASLEGLDPDEAARRLRDRLPDGVELPPVERVFHAGDGTLVEMRGQWFELRASGTDAVLRYYMEGRDAAAVGRLNEAFTRLRLD